MTLMRWNPIKDLLAIQEEMNKLFDEKLDRFSGEGALQERIWEPLVDIYEDGFFISLKQSTKECNFSVSQSTYQNLP